MAFAQPQVDFNYFLARKYALLQQQADAGTTTANAGATAALQNANTNTLTGTAAARLDNTRADLAPAESASRIGLEGAQGGLLTEQAVDLRQTRAPRIRGMEANTNFTITQDKVATREGLRERPILPGLLGPQGYQGFRLGGGDVGGGSTGGLLPTEQQPGESHTAWVARLRGMGY